MRKIILYISMTLLISMNGYPNDASTKTIVELTVRNAKGDAVPAVHVYLFRLASNNIDGTDPSKAILSALSDKKGLAKLDLSAQSTIDYSMPLYATIVEHPASNEYLVLGSTEIHFEKGKTTSCHLQVKDPLLKYSNGFIPSTLEPELAIEEYNRWKSSQLVACANNFRPIADPANETRVEAVGFGMILSAYAKDKAVFDGIFNYYLSKRTAEAKNMMSWLTNCEGIVDPGSATDGDLDVAFALVVADRQWGGTYLESAKEILAIVKNNLIDQCTVNGKTVYVLGPGYSNRNWGGCNLTDIQYYTPAFFRVFASVSKDEIWNKLADDTYILLNASANKETGLVPDWQSASGTPGGEGRVGYFGYDACRVPWRIALDYLWNGNQNALEWCKKISNWANSVGPANIVDGYELNGTAKGSNKNSSFLGGLTVSAMCNKQKMLDAFASVLKTYKEGYWFNQNTRCLYLFTLTGNFRDPLHIEKK
jgi:endoglucanase